MDTIIKVKVAPPKSVTTMAVPSTALCAALSEISAAGHRSQAPVMKGARPEDRRGRARTSFSRFICIAKIGTGLIGREGERVCCKRPGSPPPAP